MDFKDGAYDDLLNKVEVFEDGQIIFEEDTVSGWVYVVTYGQVEIFKMIGDKKIILDHVGEGEVLGEVSFFDQLTRSAGARAVGEVGLMQFKDTILMEDYENLPQHFKVLLEAMALRIRALIKKVSILASQPQVLEDLDKT